MGKIQNNLCSYLVTEWAALLIFCDPVSNSIVDHFQEKDQGDGDASLQYGHPFKGFESRVCRVWSEILSQLKQNRGTENRIEKCKEDFVCHVIHDGDPFALPSLFLLQMEGDFCVVPSVDDHCVHNLSIVYQASAGHKVYPWTEKRYEIRISHLWVLLVDGQCWDFPRRLQARVDVF